jgi:hypothetical protein
MTLTLHHLANRLNTQKVFFQLKEVNNIYPLISGISSKNTEKADTYF